jgi:hypothetical protein
MSEPAGSLGPAAMVHHLGEQIETAFAQAELCTQRAKTGNLRERQHWLVLERGWLTLAHNIEVARDDMLESCVADNARARADLAKNDALLVALRKNPTDAVL